jgi:hypothetical protein
MHLCMYKQRYTHIWTIVSYLFYAPQRRFFAIRHSGNGPHANVCVCICAFLCRAAPRFRLSNFGRIRILIQEILFLRFYKIRLPPHEFAWRFILML